MERPSIKEIYKKIADAKNAVGDGFVNLINPDAVAMDAIELGYLLDDDLHDVLISLLNEITPKKYVGGRPPERSYEHKIITSDLFAFRTRSGRFSCVIYLKYTLFDGAFWLVSLHKNRSKGKRI